MESRIVSGSFIPRPQLRQRQRANHATRQRAARHRQNFELKSTSTQNADLISGLSFRFDVWNVPSMTEFWRKPETLAGGSPDNGAKFRAVSDSQRKRGPLNSWRTFCRDISGTAPTNRRNQRNRFDLFMFPVDRNGVATGSGEKIGGERWLPMTHSQACTAKSKFTEHEGFRIELRPIPEDIRRQRQRIAERLRALGRGRNRTDD